MFKIINYRNAIKLIGIDVNLRIYKDIKLKFYILTLLFTFCKLNSFVDEKKHRISTTIEMQIKIINFFYIEIGIFL